jgi:hypothetical protein
MNLSRSEHGAAALVLILLAGGCTSAWRFAGTEMVGGSGDLPQAVPAHRAVERVTMRIRGHELEFVGYRTCDPATRDVRAQLLLDSGISVLDVAVHDAEGRRIAGSAFEAIPGLADVAMEDLRRTWGARSVFCVRWWSPPELGEWPLFGGVIFRTRQLVTDGDRTLAAERLDDGSWLAVDRRDAQRNDPLRITLLDRDLVPEATIVYSDFDEHHVPREIRLVDLRDGHALGVEVEEVRLVPAGDGAVRSE